MIRVSHVGDFASTINFLVKMRKLDTLRKIDECCKEGVVALSRATPVDSGKTASSWSYEIKQTGRGLVVYWTNSNVIDGFNVAIGLQTGHGTGWGGYVKGIDYINPATREIFEKMANDIWQEVSRA